MMATMTLSKDDEHSKLLSFKSTLMVFKLMNGNGTPRSNRTERFLLFSFKSELF
jgi:hypothetical protein